jgi:hypothetical protein
LSAEFYVDQDNYCALEVDLRSKKPTERMLNESGDSVALYQVRCTVNFPLIAGCSLAVMQQRITLTQEVIRVGFLIEKEYSSDIELVYETAAETKEREVKARILSVITNNCAGLRLNGNPRVLVSEAVEGIPSGTYFQEIKGNNYKLSVFSDVGGWVYKVPKG